MKKILANFALTVFIFALTILAAEIFLRATHAFGARISWSHPDSILGWRFVPSRNFVYSEETPQPVPFRTNRFGWKDREWTLEKEPGVFRIAAVGDSYVESLQVSESRNFLRFAEQNLAAAGKKTEWMNFGRSGAGQAEEFLILKNDVLRFKPDLVVLFFFPVNDIDDVSAATAPDRFRPFFTEDAQKQLLLDTSFNQTSAFKAKERIAFLKEHSALISLLNQRVSLLMQRRRLSSLQKETDSKTLRGYLSLATAHPDPLYQKNYSLCKRLIKEMADTAKQNGADFLLVTVDTPAYRPAVEALLRQKDASFNFLFFEQDLETFSKENGISYLGLESHFRGVYLSQKTPLHFQYWNTAGRAPYLEYGAHTGHWNEDGHKAAAQALSEKIFRTA